MNKSNSVTKKTHTSKLLKELLNEISALTYEESLQSLDLLLDDLQRDNVDVEDLQRYYLKANIYLEHCENLLKNLEQEVNDIDLQKLKDLVGKST